MSERIPGMPVPAAAAPVKPRDAAAVVLYRGGPAGLEVFWLKREAALRFAGGYHAFPGGRVDAADARIKVAGAEGLEAALRAAAAREVFEETGVLVAEGAARVPGPELAAARRDLLDGRTPFQELLDRWGLALRAQDFLDAGRWITPPFMPVRFDARFFLVAAPKEAVAEIWPGELSEGGWVKPEDALKRWREGTALLHPPNLHVLQVMESFRGVEDALDRLRRPPHCPGHVAVRLEFQQGILVFPLETPTLPPATHTSCYVLGNGDLLIVDPGAGEAPEIDRLLELVAGLKAEGHRPLAVVVTHHHADHVGGVAAVSERLGIPVWCHELTAGRLPVRAGRLLRDGEEIVLQGAPPMRLRVLHTPGHARGHLCLVDETSRAAVVGDMVSGVSTIVIDPPEGDMTDYLRQLARLRDLPVGVIYPAHGPVIPDGPGKLTEYLLHREMREGKVLGAVPPEGTTLQELVPRAYDDVPEAVYPLAERSTLAILIKLEREGKVAQRDGRYYPAGREGLR
jgi:glyoxylase-like metal-dependent hydrolase (beta-lactamase superfamily II)/8-oxo-dGTP pyrophosphatase MutT (NUDIX family)